MSLSLYCPKGEKKTFLLQLWSLNVWFQHLSHYPGLLPVDFRIY